MQKGRLVDSVFKVLSRLIMLVNKIQRNFFPHCKKLCILFSMRKKIMAAHSARKVALACTPQEKQNLVILLFPPSILRISGGLFSILNIAAISRQILGLEYKVIVSHFPRRLGLAMYPYFPTQEIIYDFSQVMRQFPNPEKLLIHIPEYYSSNIFSSEKSCEVQYIKRASSLHINILNQNIEFMPEPQALQHLYSLAHNLTQTTAHAVYCSQANSEKWQMPQHHLSAILGKDYPFVPYDKKKNWIAYSPDPNPYAQKVLQELRKKLPNFRLIKISGVSYTRYLEIIGLSKYVISFGEGWDGYFFEPFLCGTLGCTARNDMFFPKDMVGWETLYDSFEHLKQCLPADIASYEASPQKYETHNAERRTVMQLSKDDAWNYLIKRLREFYDGNYSFYPQSTQL